MAEAPVPQLIDTPGLAEGYIETDRSGRIVRLNRVVLQLYGMLAAEIEAFVALPPSEWQPRLRGHTEAMAADPAAFLAALQRHLSPTDETGLDEVPLRDGRVLERHTLPLLGPGGVLTGRAAFLRDVTSRRREALALHEQVTRSEAIAELGELALLTEEQDSLLRLAARIVERTLGSEVVHMLQLVPERHELVLRVASHADHSIGIDPIPLSEGSFSAFAVATGGTVVSGDLEAETRFTAPRLRALGVRCGIVALVRGRDAPHGVLGAFWRHRRDLPPGDVRFVETVANLLAATLTRDEAEKRLLEREREAREMQARLALADRMASVGTLAAGVAHELNNPLSYVVANLSFLAEGVGAAAAAGADPAGELRDAVREAREGAERMRGIIRDLKTFSRVEDAIIGPVELGPVLESCVSMAWNEIKHRARFVRELGDVPPVRGNEGKLGQVFLNLLVNAAQAIPEARSDRNEIRLTARMAEDGRVAVEVRDTGTGIAPENLRRIFDPFFTTKPVGEGTGLGLTICHNIVSAVGGTIQVESAEGKGTTFRVLLLPAERPEAEAHATPVVARATRRARVLVVDDEPLVGAAVRRALGGDHEVAVVSGARQAIDRLRRETFDVVLTDLLMPEISGMELYEAVAQQFPEMAPRMVFVTGGAFTPAARRFMEAHRDRCLEKPFEVASLRELVRRHVAARPPG
ncbi:MAG: response regulator [Deltaproteobacteria bacterium]|nr:response regulator [Deltaproteobacteria bacterium]